MPIEHQAAQHLLKFRKTLSIAESCTGGLLCHRMTNIPGSSKYLKLGLVVYSNKAKIKLLKIPLKTLNVYGAVSPQVAAAMAKNVRNILQTDFGLAITGIAGPSGASSRKPIGLTYIALALSNEVICREFHFKGKRNKIKFAAAKAAFKILKSCLLRDYEN